MTTTPRTTARPLRCRSSPSPGSFLEGLAAQDFAQLGGALAADVRLRALLPPGPREWTGAEAIADQFARWFGDTEEFELIEATVGEVGAACTCTGGCGCGRSGSAPAGSPSSSRPTPTPTTAAASARLDLLCTGYRPEGDHG